MTNKNWKEIAELVGIAAIVASIVFLAMQIRQSQDIAVNERSYLSLESRLELNLAITDHARIWNAGNAGDDLDDVERTVYGKLIENQHWVSWSGWRSADQYDLNTARDLAIADFAAFLHKNPGALDTWREYLSNREPVRHALVSSYDENQFQRAVEDKLAELARK